MREIKFRAWNKVDKKGMIDLKKITPLITSIDGLFIPFDENIILMQFTGLKDKNGKEIYEGDIIGRTTFPDKVIIWFEHGFGYYRINNNEKYSVKYLDQFDVVIGNIYETPELLTPQTKTNDSE